MVGIDKVFSSVVVIHTDILEFEINFDEIVGQIRREFNQLISEVLNELVGTYSKRK
jgi:hypothetical protein